MAEKKKKAKETKVDMNALLVFITDPQYDEEACEDAVTYFRRRKDKSLEWFWRYMPESYKHWLLRHRLKEEFNYKDYNYNYEFPKFQDVRRALLAALKKYTPAYLKKREQERMKTKNIVADLLQRAKKLMKDAEKVGLGNNFDGLYNITDVTARNNDEDFKDLVEIAVAHQYRQAA